jgi:raffinose/stachyose/melibiose transport system substrate-binding protein
MNKTTRIVSITALILLGTLGMMAEAQNKKIVFLSVQNAGEGFTGVIGKLAAEYQKQNPSVTYEYQNAPQTELTQKLQLLAASNALPAMYNVGDPSLVVQLAQSGYVADVEETFKKLGIYDKLVPAAVSLLKNQTSSKLSNSNSSLKFQGEYV